MSSPHIRHNNTGKPGYARGEVPPRVPRDRAHRVLQRRVHMSRHTRVVPRPPPRPVLSCARGHHAHRIDRLERAPLRKRTCTLRDQRPVRSTSRAHTTQRGDVQRSNAPQSIRHPALCEDGAREHDRVSNACRLVSVVRCGNGLKKRERARDCADAPKVARAPVHDSGIAFDGTLKRQIGAVACKRGENVGIARTATNLRLDSRHLRGP